MYTCRTHCHQQGKSCYDDITEDLNLSQVIWKQTAEATGANGREPRNRDWVLNHRYQK